MVILDTNETTNDNKREPIRSKRMNKGMTSKSFIYIDVKYFYYKMRIYKK